MRCSRISTQPTEARGHVARVPTVRAICMKYSSQPGRTLGNVVARRQLADAAAQLLDLRALLNVAEARADDARDFARVLDAEPARSDRRRAEPDAARDHGLLLVERDRVLVHGDADLVEVCLHR